VLVNYIFSFLFLPPQTDGKIKETCVKMWVCTPFAFNARPVLFLGNLHYSDKSIGGSWLYTGHSTKCQSENNFHNSEIINLGIIVGLGVRSADFILNLS
jgi:hypothetical protein